MYKSYVSSSARYFAAQGCFAGKMPPITVLFCKNLPAPLNNLPKSDPPPPLTNLLYLGALYALVAVCPLNKSFTSGLANGETT